MNIQLPDKFFQWYDWKRYAYIDDGILYIQGDVNYENLMYSLTYSIFDYQRCAYCGQKLTMETRTLDHMYPRNWGGISIPDNLIPSCSSCNGQKSNMTVEQYIQWLKTDQGSRSNLYAKFVRENEKVDLYYQLHQHYPRPIVISANNWVFKGIHILYHAKRNGIKTVS